MKVNIWNTEGDIIDQCDSIEEAENLLREYEYEELTRTQNGREINICVMDY